MTVLRLVFEHNSNASPLNEHAKRPRELTSKNSRIKDLENRILELKSELDSKPRYNLPSKSPPQPDISSQTLLSDSIESVKANKKKQTTTDVSQDFSPIWEIGQLTLYMWRVFLHAFLVILVKLLGIFKIKV